MFRRTVAGDCFHELEGRRRPERFAGCQKWPAPLLALSAVPVLGARCCVLSERSRACPDDATMPCQRAVAGWQVGFRVGGRQGAPLRDDGIASDERETPLDVASNWVWRPVRMGSNAKIAAGGTSRARDGQPAIASAFQMARGWQQQGERHEAERIYDSILAVDPEHFGSLCGRGAVFMAGAAQSFRGAGGRRHKTAAIRADFDRRARGSDDNRAG